MNHINERLKNVFVEKLTLSNAEFLKLGTLEDEIINYNKKLHKIIQNNKISFTNEVSFMLQIKKLNSNKELLPVVICFLCDKKYINKFKYESLSPLVKGDIAAYVLLKRNVEKFFEKLQFIYKNKMYKDSCELEIIDHFNYLETLVAETYEKCNCIDINMKDTRCNNSCIDDENYIRKFIYDNLKFKIIDYKIYMKKLAGGRSDAAIYLVEVAKEILKFNENEFIKEVEHVKEFYDCLEEILEEEIEKEFEIIISSFLQNVIFNK